MAARKGPAIGFRKSLQFPDESHLTQKTYLGALEMLEVNAATFGLTVKEFEDFRDKRIAERCKVLSRNLGECVRRFGPKYKDCYRERRLIEEYCDE